VLAPLTTWTLFFCVGIECADTRHEIAAVGQVNVVDAGGDVGLGHRVIGILKRPTGIDDDTRPNDLAKCHLLP
jgi:hypothetical protein